VHRNHGTRWRGAAGALAVFIASAASVGPDALAGITLKVGPADKHSQTKQPRSARDRRTQTTNVAYTQDVQSDGEVVTVTLNGWPVADLKGGQDTGLISYAVVDGANHLSVTIAPPAGGKKPGPADAATVLIQRDDAPPFSLKWRADAQPPQPLPLHREITFQSGQSGSHFGPRAWQNAPPVTLDAAEQAIRAQVHRFRDTLNAKDLEAMVRTFAARDREDARAHGETPQQNEAAARADYQEMLAEPHWRMEPIHDERLQYHLVAGGRVVLVDYGDGRHVLTTVPAPNGDVSAFDLYLSLINGQWTIVR